MVHHPSNIVFHPNEPPLKLLRKLKKKKEAELFQLCLVEGWKCVEEAILANLEAKALFLRNGETHSFKLNDSTPNYVLENKEFEDLCNTQSPEGVLGVFKRPKIGKQLPVAKAGELHLVLYDWRDPNNIGAVVRSARGLGAKSVNFVGYGPDFFSSKVIRTSMGSVFHSQLNCLSEKDFLQAKPDLYLADAKGEDINSLRPNPQKGCFLLVGSESHGWPAELGKFGQSFSIPLENQLESLSAPIAASIALFAFKNILSTKE